MSEFLFSYGTLTPQYAPPEISGVLAEFRPYAEGWVHGTLYDLGEYPGAVLDSRGVQKVFGSVFVVPNDPELLHRLDEYEGFNPKDRDASLFVRKLYPVTLNDGRTMECWLYEYNGERGHAPILATGRYKPGRLRPAQQTM